METNKKPHDKLMAYKTLVVINLIIAVMMFVLRYWVAMVVRQVLDGEIVGGDGPAEFAVMCLGSFMVKPATLILLIVAAVITAYQSAKLVEKQHLTINSPWLLLAVIGMVIEAVAVFL